MPNYDNENPAIPMKDEDRKMLNEIMREFALISDVKGIAIAKVDGSGVLYYQHEDRKLSQFLESILELILNDPNRDIKDYKHGMFIQSLIDVNGRKILLTRLRSDIVVMCILDKNAYVGLAMLVLEGFIREIDEVIFGVNT